MSRHKSLTLSIVIPAYNEENYLEACLRSVARQTVAPDEVIVVDNHSRDRTAKIARQFPFVRCITEPKQKLFFARRTGFNAVTSDIIGRIDADTILSRNWVEHVKKVFANQKVDAISGSVEYYDMRPFVLVSKRLDNFFHGLMDAKFRDYPFLFGSNMALRRTAWQAVEGGLCYRRDIYEDIDLAIHLKEAGFRIKYDKYLHAGASARRYDDPPRKFYRYIRVYNTSYRNHGLNGLMPKASIAIHLVVYTLMSPWRRAYDERLGKRTLRNLIHGNTPRKNPMH